jgi:hypothetical protein
MTHQKIQLMKKIIPLHPGSKKNYHKAVNEVNEDSLLKLADKISKLIKKKRRKHVKERR